jgi:uncharacterized protein
MGFLFEWDPDKAESNSKKHHVSFDEASTVFGDPLEMTVYDPDHSDQEDRFISIGMSEQRRILVVSYTERPDRIRIISARVANKLERKEYEERR